MRQSGRCEKTSIDHETRKDRKLPDPGRCPRGAGKAVSTETAQEGVAVHEAEGEVLKIFHELSNNQIEQETINK